MKITADTNVLVRAIPGDDTRQSRIAQAQLARAEAVALPMPALCELVWVLSQGYGINATEIGEMLGINATAVHMRLSRARQRLAEKLAAQGVTCPL